MKKTINVITLGCSKNVVDSEKLMAQLESNYYIVFDSDEKTDIAVINTCGFIADAKEESIDTIINAIEAKNSGNIEKVFIMGCLSQRYGEELSDEFPEADGIFGVNNTQEIIEALNSDMKKELYGERHLTTPSHYAYLKISEGCDRSCSFCAIPLIRGKHISTPKEDLVKEAQLLADKGVKELILIAQDLTYYGIDLYGKRELPDLINRLSETEGIEWIRLHYTYPAGFPTELLDVIKNNPKVCKYIDIPLQHISSTLLKSMKRGLDGDKTKQLISKFREEIPEAALRTTIIVGYPGETEEDFQELYEFVEQARFDRLGVFTYSHEEDTPAINLTDNIPEEIKSQRQERIMMLQQQISYERNKEKTGSHLKVIIDRKEKDFYIGRTEYDSPEVDNEVIVYSEKELKTGEFYNTRITDADFFELIAEVI